MKKVAAYILVLASQMTFAQGTEEFEITPPQWEWIVPPASPALFEREGVIQPSEQSLWRELWPPLRDGRYQEALDTIRREDFAVLEDMELGVLRGPLTHANYTSAALLYLIGYTYSSLDQPAAAETAFRSALQYLPDYVRVHESLGLLYIGAERYTEARVHLSRAAELGFNTASLYGSLGFLNQATDNPWGAVSAYQQATMLDSENEQWQRGLLHALNQSHNYPSALALVEQLLQRHPNDADLWVFRAYLAQQTGNEEAALASLETAIRLGHDSISNLQICATLHMRIGSVARATELLELGFISGMDYMFVDQALAWLIRQNEWGYAEELISGARPGLNDLNDSQRSSLLTHGAAIAAHDGDTDAARDQLETALELDASNAYALMELAVLHESRGDYGQAELLYQRASAFEQYRESATISLAQLAIDQTRYERALDLLRDIVQRNPLRFEVRRNIEILEDLVQLRSGI